MTDPRVPNEVERSPNILYVMADQMAAPLLKMYNPDSVVKTPTLDRLAKEGVVFESAYCNSPLCAPSRFALVTGQLPSKIGAYDNASNLAADFPTYAHYLRRGGYHTALSGKMHFVGPDQLHGFEQRLTSDIYPGDYGWSVNWDESEVRPDWYHNMSSVLDAGPVVCTNQLDFDNEVIYKATQYLYDQVRYRTDQPFALTVSMTHPHDPYNMTKEFWDLYENVEIPLPKTPAIPDGLQDPHSQRLLKVIDLWGRDIPEDKVIAARRAYFAACSYVDAQIAKLLRVLEDCGLAENTIIIFSGDHGDMLGERGLWYKMNWFEMSARVPLLVFAPTRYKPSRVKENVSTMDLLPTFVSMAGLSLEPALPINGTSLMPFITGENGEKTDTAIGEYMGEGTLSTLVMIRRGQWKFIYSPLDPPQLYDIAADPEEINNLAAGCPAVNAMSFAAANPKHASLALLASAPLRPHLSTYFSDGIIPPTPPRTPGLYNPSNPSPPNGIYLAQGRTPPNGISNLSERTPPNGQLASFSIPPNTTLAGTTPQADVLRGFLTEAFARWDFEAIHKTVLESQRRRRLVHSALMEGKQTIWEYAPRVDPGAVYIRNRGKGNLDDTEWVSRWPRVGRKG